MTQKTKTKLNKWKDTTENTPLVARTVVLHMPNTDYLWPWKNSSSSCLCPCPWLHCYYFEFPQCAVQVWNHFRMPTKLCIYGLPGNWWHYLIKGQHRGLEAVLPKSRNVCPVSKASACFPESCANSRRGWCSQVWWHY